MERTTWFVPLAAIGSILVTAATFLQYAHAHRADQPGGYLPIFLGALAIGLLATLCSYFVASKPARSAFTAFVSGVSAAVVFAVVLVVTLIWSFGS